MLSGARAAADCDALAAELRLAAAKAARRRDARTTRPPGYVLAVEAESDRPRSVRATHRRSAGAGSGGAGRRAASRRSTLWRGEPLADLALRAVRRAGGRAGSRSSGSRPLRTGRRPSLPPAAGSSSCRARAARAQASAARAAARTADARAVPLGAPGRRAGRVSERRVARSSTSSGSTRVRACRSCTRDPAAGGPAEPRPRRAAGARMTTTAKCADALLAGRLVPVLGTDVARACCAPCRALRVSVRRRRRADPRLAVRRTDEGRRDRCTTSCTRCSRRAAAPTPMHRFFAVAAAAAARARRPHQLLVTTSYDLALEQALPRRGRGVRRRLVHRRGPPPRPLLPLRARRHADVDRRARTHTPTELSLERRTGHPQAPRRHRPTPQRDGRASSSPRTTTSTISRRRDVAAAIPVALAAKLRRSHFLFLGYAMRDWNLRVVLERLWGDEPLELPLVGGAAERAAARAASSGVGATSMCSSCRSTQYVDGARPLRRRGGGAA